MKNKFVIAKYKPLCPFFYPSTNFGNVPSTGDCAHLAARSESSETPRVWFLCPKPLGFVSQLFVELRVAFSRCKGDCRPSSSTLLFLCGSDGASQACKILACILLRIGFEIASHDLCFPAIVQNKEEEEEEGQLQWQAMELLQASVTPCYFCS
jgi:hypothetical protein